MTPRPTPLRRLRDAAGFACGVALVLTFFALMPAAMLALAVIQ